MITVTKMGLIRGSFPCLPLLNRAAAAFQPTNYDSSGGLCSAAGCWRAPIRLPAAANFLLVFLICMGLLGGKFGRVFLSFSSYKTIFFTTNIYVLDYHSNHITEKSSEEDQITQKAWKPRGTRRRSPWRWSRRSRRQGERRGIIDAYTQAETAHSIGRSGLVKPRSEERNDNL
jgi:hypothetical protein